MPEISEDVVSYFGLGVFVTISSFLLYNGCFGSEAIMMFLFILSCIWIIMGVIWDSDFMKTALTCIITILVSVLFITGWKELGTSLFKTVFKYAALIGVLEVGGISLKYLPQYIRERKKVEEHNKREQERLKSTVPEIIKRKMEIQQRIVNNCTSEESFLKGELQKVSTILQKAYSQTAAFFAMADYLTK